MKSVIWGVRLSAVTLAFAGFLSVLYKISAPLAQGIVSVDQLDDSNSSYMLSSGVLTELSNG